jgi:SAM-dependent methyltransferase
MTTATIAAATTASHPDYDAIKAKQNAVWTSGDYAVIGTTLQLVGETLAEALDLRAGRKVLDVAAGNGNFTLAAARRGGEVTSTDYVAALLERGSARIAADGLKARFELADAEELPYEDASFDAVGSTFGVMFAPHQEVAAAEMLRVCRGGGRIGLANWTPDGFVGAMLKAVGRYAPPPAGIRSPVTWGTRARLDELFGRAATSMSVVTRQHVFRYRSPDCWLKTFKNYYGPMHKAFASLDADGQAALGRDLLDVAAAFNTASDGTMVAPGDYLEVVLTRR